MNLEERIRELIAEKLADRPDLFVVEVKIVNNKNVTILLDGDEGIGIHDCALVSRYVGFHLEEENLIDNAYTLEVGSPGLDTPLTMDRQFKKNVGRLLEIKLKEGKQTEGKLLSADDNGITIMETIKQKGKKNKEEEKNINKNEIAEVKVGVSFK
ncbi:ribosome assembly cofactor RimP [Pedobacter sp. SD-b]|uniref:Ribosome maturation factor RimP n=1 Tax=Pedobacter segetis TaxID=2793069 RepID=A0ABS1BF85_9SPHI|nr:ribosome assembly cofactor RimP [Pedobacter segetis]MBK0381518.1 ribosome assembly cofactor RimP [Pedobacter segetis]